jgi:hypothetical protein
MVERHMTESMVLPPTWLNGPRRCELCIPRLERTALWGFQVIDGWPAIPNGVGSIQGFAEKSLCALCGGVVCSRKPSVSSVASTVW